MAFVVLIFCFALGLEFEEFDGILIYRLRLNWALSFEGVGVDLMRIWRERNSGMRGKEIWVERETGLRKK